MKQAQVKIEQKKEVKFWGLIKEEAMVMVNLIDKILLVVDNKEKEKMQNALETLKALGLEEQAKALEEKIKEQKTEELNKWIVASLKKFKKLLKEKIEEKEKIEVEKK